MKKTEPRIIASVDASEPPESVKTLEEWLVWREAENRRMFAELQAQLNVYALGVQAQFERDVSGETLQ